MTQSSYPKDSLVAFLRSIKFQRPSQERAEFEVRLAGLESPIDPRSSYRSDATPSVPSAN
jgi:hypothetical protein